MLLLIRFKVYSPHDVLKDTMQRHPDGKRGHSLDYVHTKGHSETATI